MNWIRVSTEISRDPQVKALARELGVKRAEVIGCITSLLTSFPAHARTGDISRMTDDDLEEFACWERKAGAFAKAYRAAFCNEAGVVRSWDRYNGSAMRENENDRERKAAKRAELKRLREAKEDEEHRKAIALLSVGPSAGTSSGPSVGPSNATIRDDTYDTNELPSSRAKEPNAEGDYGVKAPLTVLDGGKAA